MAKKIHTVSGDFVTPEETIAGEKKGEKRVVIYHLSSDQKTHPSPYPAEYYRGRTWEEVEKNISAGKKVLGVPGTA